MVPAPSGPDAGNPSSQCIPAGEIQPQATALLNYVPLPTISGQNENYQRLTSATTNTTQIGVRLMHNFGKDSSGTNGLVRMARQFLGQGNPGITQSMNANFNYSHSASDSVNLFPELGGKTPEPSVFAAAGLLHRQRTPDRQPDRDAGICRTARRATTSATSPTSRRSSASTACRIRRSSGACPTSR